MREFEKQIARYKALLPHMRERVTAAFIMLIIAVVVTASSSFAWAVLSVSPEVKGMNTTITANGNLEIALANGTVITAPNEAEVGDNGRDLIEKNTTWGNLVNLADPSYGMENIVLRPASLNQNDLLNQPLYGAGYGTDGRVDTLVSDFAYAYWNQDQFSADQVKYGVRTVSSVTYGEIGSNIALAEAVRVAEESTNTAVSNLKNLAKNSALQDLVGLMGDYVNAQVKEKMSGEEPIIEVSVDEVDSIYYLMSELSNNMKDSANALAAIFNISVLRNAGQEYAAANKYTGEFLLTAPKAEVEAKLALKNSSNVKIVSPKMISYLWTLRTDYGTLQSDMEVIGTYIGRDDVVYRNLRGSTFPAVETYINHIVKVQSTKVNGTALGSLGLSNIGSLTGGGAKSITITEGILKNMDKFTGANVESNELSITVMGSTAKGVAKTDVASPFVLPSEHTNAIEGDSSFKGTDPIAGDTFGLALDFFVRTNAPDSHLILQGSPEYEEREETVTAKIDGNVYNLYVIDYQDEELIAYLNTNDNSYYMYDRESNIPGEKIGTAGQVGQYATLLTEKVKYIVGYNGVNRVWDTTESANIDKESTTQGAGSCYVFYASSPEDQKKALQLLEHFRIAFIDQEGNLLGSAQLNTKNKFEQSGKVVVPLELSVTNTTIEGPNGDPLQIITSLERNTPTFITALVYLDGGKLTNDQVLAAGEIQGQLNIQFGSTADLDAMDDPELMEAKCSVTATMEGATKVNIDTASEADLKKKIIVTVNGYTPNKVEAYFLREVNSTQGIRQNKITFSKNAEGKWEGEYQFTSAGKYILREVMLDGVMYELKSDPIVFTVEGFAISNVYCVDNNKTYMTTNNSFKTSVSLTFATNNVDKMPKTVKGAFVHKETGNRTTVYFTRSVGSTWTGDATFTTSGEYVLEYVELDNQYTGLAESQHISINLYVGITASVYTGDDNFALENGETRELPMSMVIKADTGELIKGLTGVWLQYSNNGSGIEENGIGASMVWNANRQMYEGTFNLSDPGIYKYHYVSINIQGELNYLYTAQTSPVITAISSNPPKYVSKSGFGEAISLNNDAAITIRMKNANAATIDAEFENEKGEVYYVRGVMTDYGAEQDFTFTLPIFEGKQSGTWKLNRIYLTDIYGGANNTLYDGSKENGPDIATDTKPMYTVGNNYYFKWLAWGIDEITNEGEDESTEIQLVSTINVAFSNSDKNKNQVFGKTDAETTATLGQTHNIDTLELLVTVGDSGKSLSDYNMSIKSAELKYNYDQSAVSNVSGTVTNIYGGYKMPTTDWTNVTSIANTEFIYNNVNVDASDATKYILSANKTTLSVAGRYVAVGSLKLQVEDSKGQVIEISVPVAQLNEPNFTVWSKAMSVTVKSIAPNKQNHKTCNKTAETEVTRTSSIINDKSVKIYCEAHKNNNNIAFDTYPRVELSLANMGSYVNSVQLPFQRTGGGTVYLYTGEQMSGQTDRYEWTSAAECTRYVGQYKAARTCSSTSFTGAGELTASQLEIKVGDYTYYMDVDTITINNPHIEDE